MLGELLGVCFEYVGVGEDADDILPVEDRQPPEAGVRHQPGSVLVLQARRGEDQRLAHYVGHFDLVGVLSGGDDLVDDVLASEDSIGVLGPAVLDDEAADVLGDHRLDRLSNRCGAVNELDGLRHHLLGLHNDSLPSEWLKMADTNRLRF